MELRQYKGSGGKYRLQITAEGFSMQDDDFSIVLQQGGNVMTIPKSAFIEDESHDFYFCIDGEQWQPGIVNGTIKAFVPDFDFPARIRVEIQKFKLIIVE